MHLVRVACSGKVKDSFAMCKIFEPKNCFWFKFNSQVRYLSTIGADKATLAINFDHLAMSVSLFLDKVDNLRGGRDDVVGEGLL